MTRPTPKLISNKKITMDTPAYIRIPRIIAWMIVNNFNPFTRKRQGA